MSEQISTVDQTPKVPRVPWGTRLLRWREPITWASILLTIGFLVGGVVEILLNLFRRGMGFGRAARALSSSVATGWLVLVVLLVCACAYIKPATGHAKLLARVAALVTSVVVAYDLFLLVADLTGGGTFSSIALEIIGALLAMSVKAVLALFLWRMSVVLKGPRKAPVVVTAPEPGLAPVWQAEEAVGDQWAHPGTPAAPVGVAPGAGGFATSPGQPPDWRSGMQGLSSVFGGAPGATSDQDQPVAQQSADQQPVAQQPVTQQPAAQPSKPTQWPPSSVAAAQAPDEGPSSPQPPAAPQQGKTPRTPSLIKLDAADPSAMPDNSAETGPVTFTARERADGAQLEQPDEDHGADPGRPAQDS
ncbi:MULTISPECIES: hypothetical protein [Propionibacterium]|uniref:hypothetical protein n=1 Tax=Propionibacterium TaxID=1743 RepID=UPI000BC3127F|nr:hypothetical protein [Propionibacterium freudenreichii]SBT29647.1 Hypothetical protein PFR_JS14_1488 [Propionibacterium freudenreichii]